MSDRTKIFFRADGSSQIGLGHVVRSCALAQMLSENFECHFFIQSPSDSLQKLIEQYCQYLHILPPATNIVEEAQTWVKELDGSEIIVLDGYHFMPPYQQVIKANGNKLVCIDDIHTSPFLADVIINHAGGICKSAYQATPSTCFYLGTDYVLLRPAFKPANNNADRKEAVLICLGGADTHNMTLSVLKMLESKKVQQTCFVVLGSAFSHKEALLIYAAKSSLDIHIRENLSEEDLAALMQTCKYAICPPSTISYEYLTVGGELYLVQIADNQKHVYAFLTQTGLAFDGKDIFVDDQQKLLLSHKLQAKYFDNRSKERFIRLFSRLAEEKYYQLRAAATADKDVLFNWVNEEEVRKNSLNSNPVSYDVHIQWFQKKLEAKDTKIFLMEKDQVPVGQIRIDLEENSGTALIDYSIDKAFRGKGLGLTIIRSLIIHLGGIEHNIKYLKAVVKKENTPSAQVFEILNFERQEEQDFNGQACNVYTFKLSV
ncbi:UDP-2,4-diacetamido-2,4,6-trideoxy-beta-L-altropyranose hydrolase [Chitinophaga niabensis]|uniref:UDP-2,4-diacetamido-2,4,6-trideoxy-beta-L-altropyranose hydrolase n=1 Tax=Chitinophaga niabensis TaxID=536979 RepID=A0A1N6JXY9_9BACT|nr:UDP-2,4-diacetamido-2,4,6-trideoxy-beta-L-altropyranose hydrolase [Chitinophaga niabensis]SIO49123.1 UDP-2,4-diacetamido-2,4,6-trideoxy-beta-L-altropyranose hydrolase [Chitinophaga niabensis]